MPFFIKKRSTIINELTLVVTFSVLYRPSKKDVKILLRIVKLFHATIGEGGYRNMSFKHFIITAACVLLLTACGNDSSMETDNSGSVQDGEQKSTEITQQEETNKEQKSSSDTSSTKETETESQNVESASKSDEAETEAPTEEVQKSADEENGFSVVDGKVEAAKEVPVEDEKAILAAFDEYINSFNAEDIKRYEKVLAQNPEGFDLQEDLKNVRQVFDDFDIKRQADNITITEYSSERAYVYADLIVDVEQDNNKARDEGKQLTQFVKESSGWKVTSLQAIGSAANE